MKTVYESISENDVLEATYKQFTQKFAGFFKSKPWAQSLNTAYFNHAMRNFQTLASTQPELTTNVTDMVATVHCLLPKIRNQQVLDHIASALFLTTQYVEAKIKDKDEFQTRLKQECGIIMQKHHALNIAGYSVAVAISISALALGVALPYVALAIAVSVLISGLTYQHANDPYRIIGDKLLQIGFEQAKPPASNVPDVLSQCMGI